MDDAQIAYERRVFEDLRERLVDRTRRSRLLNFGHGGRTPMIRIVDEPLNAVMEHLRSDGRCRFRALPDPDGESADERTPSFRAALSKARLVDDSFRTAIAAIDPNDASAAAKEARIERDLRDRVRQSLGLAERPKRKTIDMAAVARERGVDPSFDLAAPRTPTPTAQTDDWLQTLLFPDQLHARLSALHRNAREIEQETGVSTLHLAFGFLEWFESDISESAFSSPLLLLPVSLDRRPVTGGEAEFRLAARDAEPVTNLSLELRLRDDFRLKLPRLDAEADDAAEVSIIPSFRSA